MYSWKCERIEISEDLAKCNHCQVVIEHENFEEMARLATIHQFDPHEELKDFTNILTTEQKMRELRQQRKLEIPKEKAEKQKRKEARQVARILKKRNGQ